MDKRDLFWKLFLLAYGSTVLFAAGLMFTQIGFDFYSTAGIVIIAVALIAIAGAIWKPVEALAGVLILFPTLSILQCVYCPYELFSRFLAEPNIGLLNSVGVFSFFTIFLLALAIKHALSGNRIERHGIELPVIAFILLVVINLLVFSPDSVLALNRFLSISVFFSALFSGLLVFEDGGQIKKIARIMVVSALIAAAFALTLFFIGIRGDSGSGMAFGAFYSGVHLGNYLAMIAPITIALFFLNKQLLRRLLYSAVVLISIGAMWLADAKAALLSLAASPIVCWPKLKWFRVIGVIIVLAAFLAIVLPCFVIAKGSPEFVGYNLFLGGRCSVWTFTAETSQQNPLTGNGMGNPYNKRSDWNTITTGNIFLLIFAETGLIGLLLFIWIPLAIIKKMLEKITQNRGTALYFFSVAFLFSFSVYLTQNLVEEHFVVVTTNWLAGLIVAMALAAKGIKQKSAGN